MTTADADRWDARYADAVGAVRPSAPDALIEAGMVEATVDGTVGNGAPARRALDVACGRGAQSVWMAQRGYDVTALDASPRAIEMAVALAESEGVADRVDARIVDLDAGLPVGLQGFDLIVCQRFRAVDLYGSFVDRLRVGGTAVVTVLSVTGAADPGPFHAPSHELAEAFDRDDVDILDHHESDGQESIVVRRTA